MKRKLYYSALLCGIVLAVATLTLGLWIPLYFVAGLLISPLRPARSSPKKQWRTQIRSAECSYAGADPFTGLAVECIGSGKTPQVIGLLDPRKDTFEDELADARSRAEYRATILNSVGVR